MTFFLIIVMGSEAERPTHRSASEPYPPYSPRHPERSEGAWSKPPNLRISESANPEVPKGRDEVISAEGAGKR